MALRGQGATLKYTVGGGSAVAVPLCKSIKGPKVSFPELDFTNLDTVGNYKEYIVGMADGGEVSFECVYSKATAVALGAIKGLLHNGTDNTSWTVTGPESSTPITVTFDGFLKDLELPNFETDAVAMITGSVKICGPITIA